MHKYNWNYPTTMWVGENRINDIALACKNLDIKNHYLLLTMDWPNQILLKTPYQF